MMALKELYAIWVHPLVLRLWLRLIQLADHSFIYPLGVIEDV
jgi:hypothetical protein